MAHDVFISYSSEDKSVADAVCHALEAEGIQCWIAPRDVRASQDGKLAIVEAIRDCEIMFLIFSDQSSRSDRVEREVDIAFEEGHPIVLFQIEDVSVNAHFGYRIASRHWLDATSGTLEDHIDQLSETMESMLSGTVSRNEKEKGEGQTARKEEKVSTGNDSTDSVGPTQVSGFSGADPVDLHCVDWDCLPQRHGKMIISEEHLCNLIGDPEQAREIVESLPESGNNLERALGLEGQGIDMSFICVDDLFAPYLTLLTVDGLSQEWDGLTVQHGQQTEYYLVPLAPKILEVTDQEELLDSLGARLDSDGQNYIVRLQIEGAEVTKLYSTTDDGILQLDPDIGREEFDLRLFPNFDLSAVRHLLSDDGQHVDDRYYARLRLSPYWDFDYAPPFAVRDDREVAMGIQSELLHLGDDPESKGEEMSPGKAAFYVIPEEPDGFYVPERGFCLLDLEDPRPSGISPAEWTVGIDFGTSNTCVAYKEEDRKPNVLELPIFTTTLLDRPNYNAKYEGVFEGASAVLDFFYKFGRSEEKITYKNYFPTHLITQQGKIEDTEEFEIENGLIYFDSIGIDDPTLLSLIEEYPKAQRDVPSRFIVKEDIKRNESDWLRIFMHHLRKRVLLTAAARNAKVEEIRFSYPSSLETSEEKQFEADLRHVWTRNGFPSLNLISEGKASRKCVVEDRNQHVILNIRGEKTNIFGVNNKKQVFNVSFPLTTRKIHDYVVGAPTFRKKFVEAIQHTAKREVLEDKVSYTLLEKFTIAPQTACDRDMVLRLWMGLLQLIRDTERDTSSSLLPRILNYLRTEADSSGAVQGFFLSNVLLFGGLSFYAGKLLGTGSSRGFEENLAFSLSRVPITMIGNGGRLYNMLTIQEEPFSSVMKNLFQYGLPDDCREGLVVEFEGLFQYQGRTAPETPVALGLLGIEGNQHLEDVPMADIVGEEGYPVGIQEERTEFCDSLTDFYRMVTEPETCFEMPRKVPKVLDHFLTGLGEVLPYGQNGQFEVIPGCKNGWEEDIKTDLYLRAQPYIRSRGYESADRAAKISRESDTNHSFLEPLFVTQIAGLLEAVKERHAE